MKKLAVVYEKRARGSLTVEAAVIVPVILFCVLWMVQGGITLYTGTVALVEKQEMWEDFQPAGKFRKLELLERVIDSIK